MALPPESKLTPLFKQSWAIKQDHPDVLVMFRLGDFYEMFGDDAQTGAREPGLTLTSRECGQPTPKLDLADLCRALGVQRVEVVESYDVARIEEVLRAEIEADEISVVIARHPCVLLRGPVAEHIEFDAEACVACGFACRLAAPPWLPHRQMKPRETDAAPRYSPPCATAAESAPTSARAMHSSFSDTSHSDNHE